MSVCCECCVLSGRGLCDELITRPEESYRMCSRNLMNEEVLGHCERGGGLIGQKQTNKQSCIFQLRLNITTRVLSDET